MRRRFVVASVEMEVPVIVTVKVPEDELKDRNISDVHRYLDQIARREAAGVKLPHGDEGEWGDYLVDIGRHRCPGASKIHLTFEDVEVPDAD